MVRRRRARPRKRTRQFGINVIETGAALALLEEIRREKRRGRFLAKAAVKSFSRGSPILASLGPIKVRA
jgi:hypothetical protein